jgi:hypothetical protein
MCNSTLLPCPAGDPFDLPLPHDILRPVQKTAPSGPWLFPRGGLVNVDPSCLNISDPVLCVVGPSRPGKVQLLLRAPPHDGNGNGYTFYFIW